MYRASCCCKWLFNEALDLPKGGKNTNFLHFSSSMFVQMWWSIDFNPLQLGKRTAKRLNIRMVFPELNIFALFMKFISFGILIVVSRMSWYVSAFIIQQLEEFRWKDFSWDFLRHSWKWCEKTFTNLFVMEHPETHCSSLLTKIIDCAIKIPNWNKSAEQKIAPGWNQTQKKHWLQFLFSSHFFHSRLR